MKAKIATGPVYVTAQITPPPSITTLELRVWLAVCGAESQRAVSDELGISKTAYYDARQSLNRKLGVRAQDTAGLVRAAARADLLRHLPPLRLAKGAR